MYLTVILHKIFTMKKYITIGIILTVVGIVSSLVITIRNARKFENKWKTSEENVKACNELLASSNRKSAAFQLTNSQLLNMKDSLINELEKTRKELKVKEKDTKAMQVITTELTKVDTIVVKDTIFKDRTLGIDTVLQDKWYSVGLRLKYPSTVIIKPTFRSEKHIVVSMRKETVNPPKKLWILRLFQKKHKVLHVDVIEKNPYMENQESRYVEIIK